MWLPLHDVDPEMGDLEFAAGTHDGPIADQAISDEADAFYDRYLANARIARKSTGPMRAGDASFHLGWTLHRANPNRTDVDREVMTVIWFADGARVVRAHQRRPAARPSDLAGQHRTRRTGSQRAEPAGRCRMSDPTTDDTTPWWRDAVVYQIYPRSFADSNGDGIGDLAGITGKLDYLAGLGVDALWLSPIFTSPMRDFGYDVADYCGIDPAFGTDADFDELIAGVHRPRYATAARLGAEPSSSDHPWFVESRSSRDNPRRDWYVWRDRLPDGWPPTNWMSQFKGVPAWTHDDGTDQSYLHVFLAEQPDLNWANPEVEAAMLDSLRYWLDRGVDGFRSDVVNLIGKGTDVDDLPDELVTMPLLACDRPFGHELLRRIRTLLDSYEHDPMMVGEVYLLRAGESASYLGTPEAPELHLSFDFRPIHTHWDAGRMQSALSKMEADFAEPGWPTFVLSNHDQPRHRTRYGSEARARAAAVMALTVRGTPFLFAGEELGLEDGIVPPEPRGRSGWSRRLPGADPVDRRGRRRVRSRLADASLAAVPGQRLEPCGRHAGRRTGLDALAVSQLAGAAPRACGAPSWRHRVRRCRRHRDSLRTSPRRRPHRGARQPRSTAGAVARRPRRCGRAALDRSRSNGRWWRARSRRSRRTLLFTPVTPVPGTASRRCLAPRHAA